MSDRMRQKKLPLSTGSHEREAVKPLQLRLLCLFFLEGVVMKSGEGSGPLLIRLQLGLAVSS